MPVKVIVADSQFLIVEGLKSILGTHDDIEVIAEAYTAQTLFTRVESMKPDLVVMDHNSSEFFSDSALDKFLERDTDTPFLIISQENDQTRIRSILESGVNAFLTKYCDEEEIVSAVLASVKGEKYFCTKVLDMLITPKGRPAGTCEPTNLTEREIEIVKLIANGLKTRDIAEQLHLSPHTVHTHRKEHPQKTGCKFRL